MSSACEYLEVFRFAGTLVREDSSIMSKVDTQRGVRAVLNTAMRTVLLPAEAKRRIVAPEAISGRSLCGTELFLVGSW